MTRRVRVTIEGDAKKLRHSDNLLRVRTGADHSASHTFLVNPSWADVTVEDLAPSYDWRAGDVIQDPEDDEVAFRERDGYWRRLFESSFIPDDEWASASVAKGWRVLRYQAGEGRVAS